MEIERREAKARAVRLKQEEEERRLLQEAAMLKKQQEEEERLRLEEAERRRKEQEELRKVGCLVKENTNCKTFWMIAIIKSDHKSGRKKFRYFAWLVSILLHLLAV